MAIAVALAAFLASVDAGPDTSAWIVRMLGMATIFAPMVLAVGLGLLVVGLSITERTDDRASPPSPAVSPPQTAPSYAEIRDEVRSPRPPVDPGAPRPMWGDEDPGADDAR